MQPPMMSPVPPDHARLCAKNTSALQFGERQGAAPQRVDIVDGFGSPSVDVDGDCVPDLSHGELVERFIRAQAPNVQFRRLNVVPPEALSDLTRHGAQNPDPFFQIIRNQLEVLKNSKAAAICMSLGCDMPIQGNTLGQDLSQHAGREKIIRHFTLYGDAFEKIVIRATNTLKGLAEARRNTPIYVAAGNSGKPTMNVFGLAQQENLHHVGAMNAAQNDVAVFSADNPLVTERERGVYAVTRVKGGYDITGDGLADVMNAEVSGGQSFASRFVGRPLSEVRASATDIAEVDRQLNENKHFSNIEPLCNKLFSWDELVDLRLISAERAAAEKAQGDYAAFKPLSNFEPFAVRGGNVLYEPEGPQRRDAVNCLRGTSFANATRLGRDLSQT